jgi:hypothetical protein
MPWKNIPGYETSKKLYQASYENIRSVDKKTGNHRILSQTKRGGYMRVTIGYVHRLIAIAYVLKPSAYDETYSVDHIDNNTMNNHPNNLVWKDKKGQALNKRTNSRPLIYSLPVVAICVTTGNIIKFKSLLDVESIGANYKLVSLCLTGERKTHAGYLWSPPLSSPDLTDEKWKLVANGQRCDMYLSNLGRTGYKFTCGYMKKISPTDKITERRLEETKTYPSICIKGKQTQLHILVWETFKGNIPTGMVIHHKNHDKTDARLENLELVTQSENILAAIDFGKYDGKVNARKPITIDGVPFNSTSRASADLNIKKVTINARLHNENFTGYNFV